MQLQISPGRLISEVQAEFNQAFPYLKIEFFKNSSKGDRMFSADRILRQNLPVSKGQLNKVEGVIDVDPKMTVRQLEKTLQDRFNLLVQVFRRSGNVWLETTMTDDWTLIHQNNHGREISQENRKKDLPDFDLERNED
jgi:hypothetical protein